MVVGLLGILKAGGAYVPLDPLSASDAFVLRAQLVFEGSSDYRDSDNIQIAAFSVWSVGSHAKSS